jgi:uncharacterized metal-binding protein YceD (DUF177 family)
MKTVDPFVISFRDLKSGTRNFDLIAGDSFFERYPESEIHRGEVHIGVELLREERMLDFHLTIDGNIVILCDRCNEPVTLGIGGKERLIVKLGDEYREESDEVQIIPETENTISLAPFIYEYIHLLLPMRRVHPDRSDGTSACDPEALKRLEELNKRPDHDDRWDALNKLKIENRQIV